ncbi:LysM domain-containing protein [uncultured Megasphaera sp.]|uniref:LysM peptidoglycan-binding domain-containing protein n=1 Tax=uncultured Megasphaera sp. TaxID=165188 RepID=UPI00266D5879|nr:LysM domain-containing protein [uncultured Megasphaera sp.]
MKTVKIYEHGLTRPKRKPRFRMIRTGLAIMTAFGIGLYLGSATPWSQAETVAADTAIIHVVDKDETLWEIAGPVADKTGQDVREVIYEIQVNNNLGPDPTLKPGQRLVIRY